MAASRKLFGVPVTRFYDDHQVSEPSYARGSGQEAHFWFHEVLRFHFDLGKHVGWAPLVVYTGVVTDWSCEGAGYATVGVTQRRRQRLVSIIRAALTAGLLTPTEAGKLRGKARWCVAPVFGRIGIAVVNLLRARQVCKSGDHSIDEELRQSLELLAVAVMALPNFVVRLKKQPLPPVVVLSDASWESSHTWLGYLVCCPIHGCVWAGQATPEWLLQLLRRHKERSTYIGQLEALAAAAPYFSSVPSVQRALCGRNVMHYVDNQGACYALINGGAKDDDMNRCVFIAGMRQAVLGCNVWYDYVPSASNIADLPTRLDDDTVRRLDSFASRVPFDLPPEWCLGCAYGELAVLFPRV